MSVPVPRWFTAFESGHSQWYVRRFAGLAADGADLDGEARLVDALIPRGSRVLDAGSGPGRVAAALHDRGHTVVGVDVDEVLIDAARTTHVGPRWVVGDLAALDPAALDPAALDPAGQAAFDAVVLAGNVMVYLAPGTEAEVLFGLVGVLRPGGVLVAGFNIEHPYSLDDFYRDCTSAGLVQEHRFATWDLRPWAEHTDWAVTVWRRPA